METHHSGINLNRLKFSSVQKWRKKSEQIEMSFNETFSSLTI